ncbi:MAG TPA: glycosyltransferase family 39 protein [Tepidisphaeraceae bacterium]|jgi:4-amino-4-deoxy-L-arabinose transferase-like glycosyltransferase
MATATQPRSIGWPGAPIYSRQLGAPRPWRGGHWLALGLIILLGAALRFTMLDHPAIWGDEAATFGRTSGSFQDLCDILRTDGFAPLHYELYWWLHNHFLMTPFMMRLVPAIAGTLTIPAIYFLARMLTSRRVALWAALFTACSAWMLNYSRDAKMYSEFWLFATLNYACLIWWFKNKNGIAWWCFVVSGIAMVGTDALGFVVIGIGLVWFFTQAKVHWLSSLAYLLALAIIGLGPLGYYHYFNDWHRGQLNWIDYNSDRTAPQLVLELASSLLFKYQFSSEAARYNGIQSDLAIKLGALGISLVTMIVILGALPWRKFSRAALITVGPEETSPQPWWRVLFWLLVATVVPCYAWYCASTDSFATPHDWWMQINQCVQGLWPWMIIVAVVVAALSMAAKEIAATLAMLLLVILAVCLGAALDRGGWNDPAAILDALNNLLIQPWFIVAGFGVAAGLIWNYCAPAGFIRATRVTLYFMSVIVVDLAVAAIVALFILSFHALSAHHSFSPADLFFAWKSLLLNPVILLIAALLPACVSAYRGSVDLRWRLRRWSSFIAVIGGIVLLCEGVTILLGHPVQSLWVPRYLGFIWPPLAIGLVILIHRLPTRGLRIAALIGVIGLNLFNFSLRVFADNEPPVDKVVNDISTARSDPKHVHTVAAISVGNFGPGGGSLQSYVGEYYLELDHIRHKLVVPSASDFHDFAGVQLYDFDSDLSAGHLHQILQEQPKLHELIIWTGAQPDENPQPPDDIAAQLGDHWKLTHDNFFFARDHWSWRTLFTTRRRVYQR